MTFRTTIGRTSAALVLGAAALALTGCAQIHQQVGNAWAVTYEVSVDSADASTLRDVAFVGSESRGDAPEKRTLSTASTKPGAGDGDDGATWTHESIVLAEDPASVMATPEDGRTATCRILLDGKRVIAEEQGQPGQPVHCKVTTPKFD
ncbi:hypothetical protein ASG04_16420 [Curtobacterium sp. Leaf183]|uniref:hypothetical protein n=1 Tax=Curtobacterium sp. Leaf183 TaxID=1736291 RepID=UPI00070063FF|nr:hypothetical protein [Curtobacterium sp. Leaf183]KQS06142.1 hypothetical protein ASG04_16420 [Curtobacterium sp. Leaf183]